MKKKNGFTLIELLAVIVILSILIVIATPNVMRTINNSKQNAFEIEVKSYLKAAQNIYLENKSRGLTSLKFTSGYTNISPGECNGKECKLDMDGDNAYCISVEEENEKLQFKFLICNPNGIYASSNGEKIPINGTFKFGNDEANDFTTCDEITRKC